MDKQALEQEVRRMAYGSTYWLCRTGLCNDLWHVTADGVSITAPTKDRQAHLAQLDALTE